jgi:hypothetical protein
MQAAGELAADLLHTVLHHECRALVSEELAEAVKQEQMRKREEQRAKEELGSELAAEIVHAVADAECSALAAEELAEAGSAAAAKIEKEEEERRVKAEEEQRAKEELGSELAAEIVQAAEEAALAQATAAAEAAALAAAIIVAEDEREGMQGVVQYLRMLSPRYAGVVDDSAIQRVVAQVVYDLATQVERTLHTLQVDAGRDSEARAEEQQEEARILRLQQDLMLAAEEQRQMVEATRLKLVAEQEQQLFFEQEAFREQQRVMQLMRSRGSLGVSFPVPFCHHSVLLWSPVVTAR